jgi:ATP-dependent exoDNAse (exonuclease V) beta subunit
LPLFEASEEVPFEKKESGPRELPEVTLETIAIDFSRPHGKRFGILVHAILSVVDLEAAHLDVQAIAEIQGRMLGASAEETKAASDTVTRALEHPLLKNAAKAAIEGRCRREVPVAIEMEDGTLVEGNVDLAFLDRPGGVWTVVDFKTDLELSKAAEKYRTQVGLYTLAIARSTNLKAQGVLLRV